MQKPYTIKTTSLQTTIYRDSKSVNTPEKGERVFTEREFMKSWLKDILLIVAMFFVNILLIAGIWYYFSHSTWEVKYYPIPEDFIPLPYYMAEEDKYLGRKGQEEIDYLGGVYTLKDFSKEEFVLHEQAYYNTASSEVLIYMNKKLEEPLLSYDVRKIELQVNEKEVVIKDKKVIRDLLSIIKEGSFYECEDPGYMNAELWFDLKCNMSFQCCVECVEDKIYISCFNTKENCWRTYDVTKVLKDFI